MSVSGTQPYSAYVSTGSTLLTVLAQSASLAAQQTQGQEIANIDNDITNRLNNQIAALQNNGDTAVTTALQQQITSLQNNETTVNKMATQYGANANVLADLQSQIASLQTAAANGDFCGLRPSAFRGQYRCRRSRRCHADRTVPAGPGERPPGHRPRHRLERDL